MTTLDFFEKPGCGGNARQRAILEAAGHELHRYNLLTYPWTQESLMPFFEGMGVPAWFNPAAPQIKSGEIQPERLDEAAAMALLLQHPLLIRRPLLRRADGQCMAGFDTDRLEKFLPVQTDLTQAQAASTCTRTRACP